MRKFLLKCFIIGLMAVLSFAALTACNSNNVDKEALLEEARTRAAALLTEKGYTFTDLKIEYKNTLTISDKPHYFYDLTFSLETETAADYESVWDALIIFDNSDYGVDCFKEADISIMEYASYEGNLYEIDALNSWTLDRVDDYSFKYISEKTPHPEVPYVGMSEELINFTGLGEYRKKVKEEGDSEHKHWIKYTYYFGGDGEPGYIVECENGYVKSVKGPND